jgi:hypothetical protein
MHIHDGILLAGFTVFNIPLKQLDQAAQHRVF